jgi:predicted nucleic acid-binding protein
MILTQDNEYAVVLDACVLAPMPLCDTLLRLAEDPAMYRPLWSETILQEVGNVLRSKLGYSETQREHRISRMRDAFPEALVSIPDSLSNSLEGVPDHGDRHVLAAAICGHANAVITQNVKHFPLEYLRQFDVLCQTSDDFLIHQFCLRPAQVLEKLDAQASGINKNRAYVIEKLRTMAPQFVALVKKWL